MGYSNCNFTTEIKEEECIGDSLQTINTNFSALEVSLCEAGSDIANIESLLSELVGGIQTLMNIRMSLSPTTPITTTDIVTDTIYVHPYNGTAVSLWNSTTNKWEIKQFTSVLAANLTDAGASIPARNYDVYLYYDNASSSFKVQCELWSGQTAGAAPPTTGIQNGVLVKLGEPNKRLIGCLRTVADAPARTEVSFGRNSAVGGSWPKLYLWNFYNQQTASFSILETGTVGGINSWVSTAAGGTGSTNGPFEKFGGVNAFGNKVEFICRNPVVANLNSIHYVGTDTCYYFGYSLDLETPTVAQIYERTPGVPIFEACKSGALSQAYSNTINAGYHFLQVVSMTYAGNTQNYLTWTGDRHSYGTFGSITAY